MSHVRTQIRDQAAIELNTIAALSGSVHKSRVYPLQQPELPSCNVHIDSEDSEQIAMPQCADGSLLQRVALMNVDLYAQEVIDLDAEMDTLSAEVEKVLAVSNLDGLVQYGAVTLTGTTISYSGEGEQPIGGVGMQWTVTYFTQSGDPETAR